MSAAEGPVTGWPGALRDLQRYMTTPTKKFVLVVEDDDAAREAVALYLEHSGFRVASSASAEEALQLAAGDNPGLAVCDWHLGGGANGVDVARDLQASYGTRIVFMTAFPIDELQNAAADIDVRAFLRKPLSLADLGEAVDAA